MRRRPRRAPGPIAVLFSAAALAPRAAALDPARAPDQYVRRAFSVRDGMPQNSVASIAQGRDGFLWLATWGGLTRFDGVSFETFDASTSPAFRSSRVLSVLEDRTGVVWAGLEEGGLLRYEAGRFTRVSLDGAEDVTVGSLVEGPGGEIWVGTGRGLFRLSRSGTRRFGVADGLPDDRINALGLLGDRLLAGTTAGVYRFVGERFREHDPRLPRLQTRALATTRDGGLLVGTRAGVTRVRAEGLETIPLGDGPDETVVSGLLEDRDGNVWIGRRGAGLARWSRGERAVFRRPELLSGDYVRSLFEDREGNLWVGTDGGGLNRISNGRVTAFGGPQHPLGRSALPIVEDAAGGLYIGLTCNGLAYFRDGRVERVGVADRLDESCIWSLLLDSRGNLWVGRHGGGLLVRRAGETRFAHVAAPSAEIVVKAILERRNGAIWVGTNSGLFVVEEPSARRPALRLVPDTASEVVVQLFESSAGEVWAGTPRGVLVVGETSRRRIGRKDGLAGEFVRAFHEDERGAIWVGTYGGGLHRLFQGRIGHVGRADGLFDDVVSRILPDDDGNLWLSGNRGILKIRRADLDAFLDGRATSVGGELLGLADGMRTAECNGGGQPAGLRARDGRMWFPTVDGVVLVDPARLGAGAPPPPVHVREVRVDGAAVDLSRAIVLPASARNLEIHYTAPSFTAPERVRFRYRLDGHDDGWVEAGARRAAYYPFIPAGRYRFRVTASSEAGVFGDRTFSFEFERRPSFSQTPWAWGLGLAAGVGLLWAGVRVRTRQLRRRQDELSSLVADRTAELRRANEALARLATSDELTGLANHRRFQEFLDNEWRRAVRDGSSLALMFVDVDFFKRFNDTHGHLEGNACLAAVAGALAASLKRPTDLLARYGGEEFVAAMAGTELDEALSLAERMRLAVEALGIAHGASAAAPVVTVTIGVAAARPASGATVDGLLTAADQALYEGKSAGRNRVLAGAAAIAPPET